MHIRLGHSPDSDDAFMFWGLAEGRVQSQNTYEHVLKDIQTLNEWAMEGRLEFTAVSVHALSYVADRYLLLRAGGSFGEGYGPMIVARQPMSAEELRSAVVAIPGRMTSAYLGLCIYFMERFGELPTFEVLPFDEIMPAVKQGSVPCGLLIHEGQLTYAQEGLTLIEDLGAWWSRTTGLPLPLGVNVVRVDLPEDVKSDIERSLRGSIAEGLEHRKDALSYALRYARGLDEPTSDEFVGMYVNSRTLDMGEDGIKAIELFLERGHAIGVAPGAKIRVFDRDAATAPT